MIFLKKQKNFFSFLFCCGFLISFSSLFSPKRSTSTIQQGDRKNLFSEILNKKQLIKGLVRVFVKAYVSLKDLHGDIPMEHPEHFEGVFQKSLQYLAEHHLLGKMPLVSRGTGFIIEKNKDHVLVVTNYHVIKSFLYQNKNEGKNKNSNKKRDKNLQEKQDEHYGLTLMFFDNKEALAEVVGADEMWDIALLKVKPPQETLHHLKALSWSQSEKVQQGDWVMAIGNPLGYANSVHHGIVSYGERFLADESQDFSSKETEDLQSNFSNPSSPGNEGLNDLVNPLEDSLEKSSNYLLSNKKGDSPVKKIEKSSDQQKISFVDSLPQGPVLDHHGWIQTDIPIQKGNSGGPLFNIKGEVVGINTLFITKNGSQTNVSMAIPSKEAISVLHLLKKQGCLPRGYLGLYIKNIDEPFALRHQLPLEVLSGGVFLEGFGKDSPGKNKLQEGDIVVKIDGQHIQNRYHMSRIISSKTPGSKILIDFLRKKKKNIQHKEKNTTKNNLVKNFEHQKIYLTVGLSPKSFCNVNKIK